MYVYFINDLRRNYTVYVNPGIFLNSMFQYTVKKSKNSEALLQFSKLNCPYKILKKHTFNHFNKA